MLEPRRSALVDGQLGTSRAWGALEMPLSWPGIFGQGGNLSTETQGQVRILLDSWADRVLLNLAMKGVPYVASPIFKPWNLVVVVDAERVVAVFSALQGGMAAITWHDRSSQVTSAESIVHEVRTHGGFDVRTWVSFPKGALNPDEAAAAIESAALQHVAEVERTNRLERLGDLTGLAHLESFLRAFLDDHPNPERNVFVMMRFRESDQMLEIHSTIRSALAERGFDAVRADDRDYTGELWTNIEVCMTGCSYGVAVFEDIDDRAFNPNVSLELGYMMGRRKRCLILKEQRLPELPTDVVHRLYKPFDMFKIAETVRSQVIRWVDVDLGGVRP
jgi:hypothetical protein